MIPQKLLELKGTDWMKGLAVQSTVDVGGLFQSANDFDPFETMGYLQPALAPTQVDGTTITTSVTSAITGLSGSTGYVFVMGNRASNGAKFIYRINTSDQTVTDYQAQFGSTQLLMSGLGYSAANGRIVYYCQTNGLIRSNLFPTPALASEATIENSPSINNQPFLPRFIIGPDRVMYYTTGNPGIGKITNFTGTAGNTPNYLTPQSDLSTKDAVSDGTYLVVIADDNINNVSTISAQCRVFFMDVSNTSKTTADVIWDIPDRYLIGCQFVEDTVLVFGYSGIWACSAGSSPRLILPLTASKLPSNAYQITTTKNIVYWASTATGARVFAYGSLIGRKIHFQPHHTTDSDNLHTLLISSGPYFYAGLDAGTNTPKVYVHNSGSTRANCTVSTVNIVLSKPHTFSHVKVTLKSPLSASQAVDVTMFDSNGTTILSTNSKQFATVGSKKTLLFTPANSGTMARHFEDFYLTVNPQGGAVVERVTVYGVGVDDDSQLI